LREGESRAMQKGHSVKRMQNSKIFVPLGLALVFTLSQFAVGQDKATAQEVIAKVREAASIISKTSDSAQFKQKQSPWVWKDSYIFVDDCDNKVVVAHPLKPELLGHDVMVEKDARGNNIHPEGWCDAARKPYGVWIEYWWPKPGEKEGSRKLTYNLSAKGTKYVVCAGIIDDKASIAELSKLSRKK
jgi:signal transduction histidine kinase